MSIISRMWKSTDSPPALRFSRGKLPRFVKRSYVALRFYALLHDIAWEQFPERQLQGTGKQNRPRIELLSRLICLCSRKI